MLPGTAAVGASRNGCASPPAAGAVPRLITGAALQAEESNLKCFWVKAGARCPGPQVLAFWKKPGSAGGTSNHGRNPAGYQGDISEFAEYWIGLLPR